MWLAWCKCSKSIRMPHFKINWTFSIGYLKLDILNFQKSNAPTYGHVLVHVLHVDAQGVPPPESPESTSPFYHSCACRCLPSASLHCQSVFISLLVYVCMHTYVFIATRCNTEDDVSNGETPLDTKKMRTNTNTASTLPQSLHCKHTVRPVFHVLYYFCNNT